MTGICWNKNAESYLQSSAHANGYILFYYYTGNKSFPLNDPQSPTVVISITDGRPTTRMCVQKE